MTPSVEEQGFSRSSSCYSSVPPASPQVSIDDISFSSAVGLFFNIKKSGISVHIVRQQPQMARLSSGTRRQRQRPTITSTEPKQQQQHSQQHDPHFKQQYNQQYNPARDYTPQAMAGPDRSGSHPDRHLDCHPDHLQLAANMHHHHNRRQEGTAGQNHLALPADYQHQSGSVPSLGNSSVSDSASINTQDALRLIATGVKLDHSDVFAAPPSVPSESSFTNSAAGSAELHRQGSNQKSSQNAGKLAASACGPDQAISACNEDKKASKHGKRVPGKPSVGTKSSAEVPVKKTKSLENLCKHNKSTNSFFKRFSRLSIASSDQNLLRVSSPPPPLPLFAKDPDNVINDDHKAQFSQPELLNSIKTKNHTVLHLQKTKKGSKREQKKRLKEQKKQESLKAQRKKLKEYYQKQENVLPEVPPAFLLNTQLNKYMPDKVFTKAEKTYPHTVKRSSMLPTANPGSNFANNSGGPKPTPTKLSKNPTTEGHSAEGVPSLCPASSPLLNLPGNSDIKRNTLPSAPQNSSTIDRKDVNQAAYMNNFYNGGYANDQNRDLYTLSEKSFEQSFHSRDPSRISAQKPSVDISPQPQQNCTTVLAKRSPVTTPTQAKHMNYRSSPTPVSPTIQEEPSENTTNDNQQQQLGIHQISSPVNQYQKDKAQLAAYLLSPKFADNINPVLTDYSSASAHSLDFYSASSGSEDEDDDDIAALNNRLKNSSNMFLNSADIEKVIAVAKPHYHHHHHHHHHRRQESLENDGDYTDLVVAQLAKEAKGAQLPLPEYSPPPVPVHASLENEFISQRAAIEREASSKNEPPAPKYPAPTIPDQFVEMTPQQLHSIPEFSTASATSGAEGCVVPNSPLMKGHYYKSLVRMRSDKSFSSTKVRINFNCNAESDSDF